MHRRRVAQLRGPFHSEDVGEERSEAVAAAVELLANHPHCGSHIFRELILGTLKEGLEALEVVDGLGQPVHVGLRDEVSHGGGRKND